MEDGIAVRCFDGAARGEHRGVGSKTTLPVVQHKPGGFWLVTPWQRNILEGEDNVFDAPVLCGDDDILQGLDPSAGCRISGILDLGRWGNFPAIKNDLPFDSTAGVGRSSRRTPMATGYESKDRRQACAQEKNKRAPPLKSQEGSPRLGRLAEIILQPTKCGLGFGPHFSEESEQRTKG